MAKDVVQGRRAKAARPSFEPLEGRQLLSGTVATGQTIVSGSSAYHVKITSGPGGVSVLKAAKGQYAIELSGTTSQTIVTVSQGSTTGKYSGALLPVARVDVASGQLGQFLGSGTVSLLGAFNLKGDAASIQLGSIGRSARLGASGGLGSLTVSGSITLGPQGEIAVAGDLAGNLNAGSIDLQGGKITIGHDLGGFTGGSLSVTQGGKITIGHDSGNFAVSSDTYLASGGSLAIGDDAQVLSFGHDVTLDPGGRIAVGLDVEQTLSVSGDLAINGGQFLVGRDVLGALTINGNLSAANAGNLSIGRDLPGGLMVNGNVTLIAGGALVVGRDAGTLGSAASGVGAGVPTIGVTGIEINGNLTTSTGGSILVGGYLDGFTVVGTIQGAGTDSIDLTVGLDLNVWTVDGGAPGLGGVDGFNLSVAKDINGITILHGVFNSFLTAGVLITNGTIGPDGPIAVFDTEIRSGVQITNINFNGDVDSDRPVNPLGRRTRIIAGEDRDGVFELGGNIVNTTFNGSLINSAVVASVQPYGGDGSATLNPAAPPAAGALDYYDAPAGNRYVTAFGSNLGIPFAAPPFDTTTDPTVHDNVLPGAINKPFYRPPTTTTNAAGQTTTTINAPSTSTILGAVITTGHANNSDYAGFFAADTTGVYVGSLPAS